MEKRISSKIILYYTTNIKKSLTRIPFKLNKQNKVKMAVKKDKILNQTVLRKKLQQN